MASVGRVSLEELLRLPREDFYVVRGGKVVRDWSLLREEDNFQLCLRVRGGKGGFGSLLKSFRIHKSTDTGMSRDLSGRRLKAVKEEERLKKWIEKKSEREAEKERKRQEKYERLKEAVRGRSKHEFDDRGYMRQKDEIIDKTETAVEDALKDAFESGSSSSGSGSGGEEPGPSGSGVGAKNGLVVISEPSRKRPPPPANSEPTVPGEEEPPLPKQQRTAESKEEEEAPSSTLAAELNGAGAEEKGKKEKREPTKPPLDPGQFSPVELEGFESAEGLKELGLDHLKAELMRRGLKCGGTLEQRAGRLWSVKGLEPGQIGKKLLA